MKPIVNTQIIRKIIINDTENTDETQSKREAKSVSKKIKKTMEKPANKVRLKTHTISDRLNEKNVWNII